MARLALVGALVTSACTSTAPPTSGPTRIEVDPPSATASTTPAPATPGTASPTSPVPPSPPPVPARWEPTTNEVLAGAKQEAARIVHRLANHGPASALADRIRDVTAEGAKREHLRQVATPFQHEGTWARGRIVYPQLGGLKDDRASVMVVVEQSFPADGEVRSVTRTVDVRLVRRDDGTWRFAQLASMGGSPAGPRDLAPEERALLEDGRVTLPDSARWDLRSGDTSPVLVRLMSRMAEHTPYDVVVLSSGHPFHVFGSDHQSKHTRGQAVDVYLLDGQRLVDLREKGSAAHDLVRWLYAQEEVAEVGSPWALDAYGGRSFTDTVHQDHIHVGVVPERPAPSPAGTPPA